MGQLEIKVYETDAGKSPYLSWEARLPKTIRTKVLKVLNRLRRGAAGLTKSVGDRVFEIRLHDGPGYRIYYGREGKQIILLLCGGTKRTQQGDIAKAKELWKEYKSSKKQGGKHGTRN